jgi:hypothetical protein
VSGEKLKARLLVGTRKVGQSATACMLLMTQGNLASITLGHWLNATKTGILGALFAVLLTFTPIAKLYSNKWALAVIAGVSTFLADWASHQGVTLTKPGGPPVEAMLTGFGAFALSAIVSLTPIGAHIEKLAARFKDPPPEPPTK